LVLQAVWSSNDKSVAEPQGMSATADAIVADAKKLKFIFRAKFVCTVKALGIEWIQREG
jgi:hypothetical protein